MDREVIVELVADATRYDRTLDHAARKLQQTVAEFQRESNKLHKTFASDLAFGAKGFVTDIKQVFDAVAGGARVLATAERPLTEFTTRTVTKVRAWSREVTDALRVVGMGVRQASSWTGRGARNFWQNDLGLSGLFDGFGGDARRQVQAMVRGAGRGIAGAGRGAWNTWRDDLPFHDMITGAGRGFGRGAGRGFGRLGTSLMDFWRDDLPFHDMALGAGRGAQVFGRQVGRAGAEVGGWAADAGRAGSAAFSRAWNSTLMRDVRDETNKAVRELGQGVATSFSWLGRQAASGFRGAYAAATRSGGVGSGITGRLAGGIGTMGIAAGNFAADLGMSAVRGLADMGWQAAEATFKLAAGYESASVALEAMTGSATQAKRVIADITQLAIESPFRTPELLAGAKQLRSFGFEADQLVPTLSVLGDVASGTGEDLSRIIRAFGQTRVAGKLTGEELRQYTNAGIPLLENLAAVVGKPMASIRPMIRSDDISANDVMMAFNRMTQAGGLFFGMMERQSRTVQGRWSAFVETLQLTGRELGLSFFRGFGVHQFLEDLKEMTKDAGTYTGRLEPMFRKLRDIFDIVGAGGYGIGMASLGNVKDFIAELTAQNNWDDSKKVMIGFVELAIVGFSQLIDVLKQFSAAVAREVIKPLANTLGTMETMRKLYESPEGRSEVARGTFTFTGGIPQDTWLYSAGQWMDRQIGLQGSAEAKQAAGKKPDSLSKLLTSMADGIISAAGEPGEFGRSALTNFRKAVRSMSAARSEGDLKQMASPELGALVGGVGALGVEAKRTTEALRGQIQISSKARSAAEGVWKSMDQGVSPFEQFQKEYNNLTEAFKGPLNDQMKQGLGALGGGVVGEGLGVLADKGFEVGVYQSFMKLSRAMNAAATLPHPNLMGSAGAMDTLNQNMANKDLVDVQTKVLTVLEAMRKAQEAEARDMGIVRKTVEEAFKNGLAGLVKKKV